MEDNRIAKIARDGRPHSRRPPGSPPKKWKDSWLWTAESLFQEEEEGFLKIPNGQMMVIIRR